MRGLSSSLLKFVMLIHISTRLYDLSFLQKTQIGWLLTSFYGYHQSQLKNYAGFTGLYTDNRKYTVALNKSEFIKNITMERSDQFLNVEMCFSNKKTYVSDDRCILLGDMNLSTSSSKSIKKTVNFFSDESYILEVVGFHGEISYCTPQYASMQNFGIIMNGIMLLILNFSITI